MPFRAGRDRESRDQTEAPKRDSVLGIRRRSAPSSDDGGKPARRDEPRTAEARREAKKDGKGAEPAAPGPKLGNGTADQLLANIFWSVEVAVFYLKGKYVVLFFEEFFVYGKMHD